MKTKIFISNSGISIRKASESQLILKNSLIFKVHPPLLSKILEYHRPPRLLWPFLIYLPCSTTPTPCSTTPTPKSFDHLVILLLLFSDWKPFLQKFVLLIKRYFNMLGMPPCKFKFNEVYSDLFGKKQRKQYRNDVF